MSEVKAKKAFGHPAIVFTISQPAVKYHKRRRNFKLFILYHFFVSSKCCSRHSVRSNSWSKNAHSEFQTLLQHALQKFYKLDEEEFGIVSPGLEFAQMKHEQVNIRFLCLKKGGKPSNDEGVKNESN